MLTNFPASKDSKGNSKEKKREVSLPQLPSITNNTLNNAQIGENATVTIKQKVIGMQVTIGEDPAGKKAAFEKLVQEHLQQMADRLKQYYLTKGTVTTLIQEKKLTIADISLSVVDYEPKPYQAGVLEEQKVSGRGGDQKDESRVQVQQSNEILKYYESLHNPTRLIPAAQIFDAKISLPEKERKEEGVEEKERRKNEVPIKPIKRLLVLGVAGTGGM